MLNCDKRSSLSFSSPVNYGIVCSLHPPERWRPRIGVLCIRPLLLLHKFIYVEYDAKADRPSTVTMFFSTSTRPFVDPFVDRSVDIRRRSRLVIASSFLRIFGFGLYDL